MNNTHVYTIHLQPINGGYVVTVPALPGCMTQGDTYEHALEMAKEAIEGYLAVLMEDGDPIPTEPDPQAAVVVGISVNLPMAI